jgi:hypothetical protein
MKSTTRRVRVTDFGERWNRRTPSSSSSFAIETESAGCDTAALIAAFVKLPVSTPAAKCRI